MLNLCIAVIFLKLESNFNTWGRGGWELPPCPPLDETLMICTHVQEHGICSYQVLTSSWDPSVNIVGVSQSNLNWVIIIVDLRHSQRNLHVHVA